MMRLLALIALLTLVLSAPHLIIESGNSQTAAAKKEAPPAAAAPTPESKLGPTNLGKPQGECPAPEGGFTPCGGIFEVNPPATLLPRAFSICRKDFWEPGHGCPPGSAAKDCEMVPPHFTVHACNAILDRWERASKSPDTSAARKFVEEVAARNKTDK